MITPKIKTLFQFIEYLHSNIEHFKKYDDTISELHLLNGERKKLNPRNNFKDKLKSDELEAERNDKFSIIKENIIFPIRNKAIELDVCSFEKEPLYMWGELETEIHLFKDNFSKDDLPEIFSQKAKYIEYRKETKGETFFGLDFFFQNLDELTKELFDFFKISDYNEFEAFETKTIQVNNVSEAVEQMQKGAKKVSFPIDYLLNPEKYQQPTPTLSQFIDDNLHKALSLNLSDYPAINNVLQKQKDKLRDAEFESEYAEVKKFAEKAVKDLKNKLQLHLSNNPNIIYKNHVAPYLWDVRLLFEYKGILKQFNERNEQPQPDTKQKPELNEILSNQITHPKKVDIAKAIKAKYSSYKGKDFKILYEALLKLDLFPSKGKRSMFFRCLQNEGYNINSLQMLEDKHFKEGVTTSRENYQKSDDEIQRDKIIEYLKTIINTE